MHFGGHIRDGSNMSECVQRDGNIEVIFELADELQDLQRVESKIGKQLARGPGVDRPAADALQDFDNAPLDCFGCQGYPRSRAMLRIRGLRQSVGNVAWKFRVATLDRGGCARNPGQRGSGKIPRMYSDVVTQTVILAAGMGTRLGSAEVGVPKPLLTIGGMPLVAYALAHAEASGCREAVVVIGYEGARVREAIEAIGTDMVVRFIENPNPAVPNGHSLLVAEPLAAPRFFLQMVDHLFATPVLPKLTAALPRHRDAARLLVDPDPVGLDLSDATKVRLAGDRIVAIGKGLGEWDAIDTGCFVLTTTVFDALRSVSSSEPLTVSSAMRRLAQRGSLYAADIAGVSWVDVDTPADRHDAERRLAAWSHIAPAQVIAPGR